MTSVNRKFFLCSLAVMMVACDTGIVSLALREEVPVDQIPSAAADFRCWHFQNPDVDTVAPLAGRLTFDPVRRVVSITLNGLWATRDMLSSTSSAPWVACSTNTVGDREIPPYPPLYPDTAFPPYFRFSVGFHRDGDVFDIDTFQRMTYQPGHAINGPHGEFWAVERLGIPMPANHGR